MLDYDKEIANICLTCNITNCCGICAKYKQKEKEIKLKYKGEMQDGKKNKQRKKEQ